MSVEFTVVSIGTLSSNPFWSDGPGVRTAHATTTLIRDGERLILVDPSLPEAALEARLFERTGLKAESITDIFCTTLRPTHRRGIEAFGCARWTCDEAELSAYRQHLEGMANSSERLDSAVESALSADMKIVERFEPSPEKFTPAVHLYPLRGASVGSAGLLLAGPVRTVLVAGDAAITSDHVLAGRVWSGCADAETAAESLTDLIEIADVIVCGHDNYMLSPSYWMR
ncbi:MAG: MBL fold metallo-hydrolase [Planctomycetota bacterium]|nr:MBL fold metallo-hydrolase [Planctomycetota bacterium]